MFINVINASIAASWLIAAIIVLRLPLRKAPRWMTCLLWGLAGLRLVCPFSLKSIFSLIPSGQTLSPTIEYDAVPQIDSGISSVDSVINPVLSDSFAATPYYSANPMQIVMGIARYLWVIGMAVMLLWLTVSYIVLRLRVRTATRLRDNILQSERVTSPFVLGVIRPKIYLPYAIDSADAQNVIAHEQAHIARGDHIVKPLAFLVLTLHWFNPLVWLAYVLLCRDIETACDQRVIKEMDSDSRRDYSRALVRCSTRPTAAACPLAFGEVSIKARVKSVLNQKKPAVWVIAVAVVVCAAAAVCFLTDPVEDHEPFGKHYTEAELTYQSPALPASALPGREYQLTADRRLIALIGSVSENLGRLTSVGLSKDNFDVYFLNADEFSGWLTDDTAASLRRGNQNAWRLVTSDGTLIYVLVQNNGEVYIATGLYDPEGESDPYSDDSFIARVYRLEEIGSHAATDLDTAVTDATLAFNRGSFYPGEFACTAHTLLATETVTVNDTTERLTAYALVLYSEYNLVNGVPEDISGSSCPAAITFDVSADGQYTLVEYWLPEDGALYATSLKEKFPDGVSWDTMHGAAERESSCYNQACAYFGISATTSDTGGADLPVHTTTTTVTIDRCYAYHSPVRFFGESRLVLYGNGTAELTFSQLSSYVALGSFTVEGDYLTLTAPGDRYIDGEYRTVENTYTFRMDGDRMIFIADRSSDIPRFGTGPGTEPQPAFYHGCVFELVDE